MAITRRLRAIQDLEEIVDYLTQHSPPAGLRFVDTVEVSLGRLEQFPLLGRACRFRDPSLRDVRRRPVDGWKQHMIYYRPAANGIEALRIIHSARDAGAVFGETAD
jgi:toxin ParE1/3/4